METHVHIIYYTIHTESQRDHESCLRDPPIIRVYPRKHKRKKEYYKFK
jgi:hypothetical protein